jgi:hypothetical protein
VAIDSAHGGTGRQVYLIDLAGITRQNASSEGEEK